MNTDEEKIVVDLSDDELTAIGLLGSGTADQVKETIKAIRKTPSRFKWLNVFLLQCVNIQVTHRPTAPVSVTSSTSSAANTLSYLSETTASEPDLVSPFEKVHFYTGLSHNPPELLHRSDLLARPFEIPRDRHSAIPEKTAHGVYDQVLNPIWRSTVCPEIVALSKDPKRCIRVSSILPVRFSTPDEDGKPVFGPIVIWISVHPNTTTAAACRDADQDILSILKSHGVMNIVVHWIEGAVEPLVGPAIMCVADKTDPTAYIRRALTAVLGIPLAARRMADDNSQGSLGIYFHEGKDKKGNKSDRVFAITNKHVVSKATNTDYDFGRPGTPRHFMCVCSSRRFQDVVNETRAFIAEKVDDATHLTERLVDLLAEPPSKEEEEDEVVSYKRAVKRTEQYLEDLKEDLIMLQKFLKDLNSSWSDVYQRTIGWVDWAPKICHNVDDRRYTRDIGVIELEKSKWEKAFKGNCVHLGGKYTPGNIKSMFYPNASTSPSFKYPKDHLYRIQGCVPAAGLAAPHFYDEEGNPNFIVAKHGQATDLTFGRLSEMEAYTCDELENESWEVAVFNYDKNSGNFLAKGDSGSVIFDAEGRMVAFLHSGMPRGFDNHVTFGTPAHFVIEQILERYPHADFSCVEF